jgi:hypothetical protein
LATYFKTIAWRVRGLLDDRDALRERLAAAEHCAAEMQAAVARAEQAEAALAAHQTGDDGVWCRYCSKREEYVQTTHRLDCVSAMKRTL